MITRIRNEVLKQKYCEGSVPEGAISDFAYFEKIRFKVLLTKCKSTVKDKGIFFFRKCNIGNYFSFKLNNSFISCLIQCPMTYFWMF